jgi:adenosylhomocysteine nucleosidase
MSGNSSIGLIMATMLEAEPFIKDLSLLECETEPFRIFAKGHIHLILSGIGKTNAAMACAYLIQKYHPSCICNIGAAGSTDSRCHPGESYHITMVVEPDRPSLETGLPHVHTLDTLEGFSFASLATQDKAVRDPAERERVNCFALLADMEGASVVQTCKRFLTKCYLFKFVSDTVGHCEQSDIQKNILLYRDAFCEYFCERVLPQL